MSHLREGLAAFRLEDDKESGKRQTSALKQEEWFGKIEEAVAWCRRKWHAREGEASARHH